MKLSVVELVEPRRHPVVAGDKPVRRAVEVMVETGSYGVVVLDSARRPEMILTCRRLFKLLSQGVDVLEGVVNDYALAKPVTVRLEDDIRYVSDVMKRYGVKILPVVNEIGEFKGVIQAPDIAKFVWSKLPYGLASISTCIRKAPVLDVNATLLQAIKTMDETGSYGIVVKGLDKLVLLTELDLLKALLKHSTDAKLADVEAKTPIMIPSEFDAKAATEVMVYNNVNALLVEKSGEYNIVTLTDLAFKAVEHLNVLVEKITGIVLVNVETGKEREVAEKIQAVPGVKEVMVTTGPYDLAVILEASSSSELFKIVSEGIRSLKAVKATQTLVAAKLW